MRRTIQVRIFRGENKYVAECLDLPIVTEGATLDEVTANIREAIGSYWSVAAMIHAPRSVWPVPVDCGFLK